VRPVAVVAAAFLPLAVPAVASAASVLDRVVAGTDAVTLHLTRRTAPEVRLFPDPPRLVVDLPGTKLDLRRRNYPGKGRFLKKVRCALFSPDPKPVARVVLDLKAKTDFKTGWDGSRFTIVLGKNAPVRKAAPRPAVQKPPGPRSAPPPAASQPSAPKPALYHSEELPIGAEEISLGEGMTARSSCGDEACFMKAYKECSAAAISYTLSDVLTYRYEVVGRQNGRCRMRMHSVANPNAAWVGKSMICWVDNAFAFDRAVTDLSRCRGSLKDLMSGG